MIHTVYEKLPEALLPWFSEHRRELPWRADNDPYHVWVSEIMLQQTRVEAVKGYYTRFLQALPTAEELAKCDDDALHKLWEGLGYYSRVRNLKKAAQIIVEQYGGVFPREYDAVRALPGIGEYTAGAICSICFQMPKAAVDGNVLRLISRLTADDTPIDLPNYKAQVRTALESVYPDDAGAFTQALMELGATLCGPNWAPRCQECPCRGFCAAHEQGREQALPVKLPKKKKRKEDMTVFILSCGGKYALQKRPASGLLADLWQFPNVPGSLDAQAALEHLENMGLHPRELIRQVEKKHIFTHIQWNMRGFYLEVSEPLPQFEWLTAEQIFAGAALPTAFRQFWEGNGDV